MSVALREEGSTGFLQSTWEAVLQRRRWMLQPCQVRLDG